MSDKLYVFGKARESITDGTGIRFVLFLQGCPHRCPGCHNPESRPFDVGVPESADGILAEIQNNPLLDGITLSGGEPFSQAEALVPLVRKVRNMGLSVWIFSGWTFEELLKLAESDNSILELMRLSCVLVDGRYVESERSLDLRFRGSKNQRILDLPKSLERHRAVPAEISEFAPEFAAPKWE